MREQICVLIGLADQRILLGQLGAKDCCSGVRLAAIVCLMVCAIVHGRHGIGKQALAQCLYALVAVHPLLQGLGAGGINALRRVALGQTHDAPELSLAHPAFCGKHQLTQAAGMLTDLAGLAQDQPGLARGVEDSLIHGQHHRARALGFGMGAQQSAL